MKSEEMIAKIESEKREVNRRLKDYDLAQTTPNNLTIRVISRLKGKLSGLEFALKLLKK